MDADSQRARSANVDLAWPGADIPRLVVLVTMRGLPVSITIAVIDRRNLALPELAGPGGMAKRDLPAGDIP